MLQMRLAQMLAGRKPGQMAQGRLQGAMSGRDAEMGLRNQAIGQQGGGPVPGLPGVNFSPDYATAMQKAAKSLALAQPDEPPGHRLLTRHGRHRRTGR
jgi:hypothetical protein